MYNTEPLIPTRAHGNLIPSGHASRRDLIVKTVGLGAVAAVTASVQSVAEGTEPQASFTKHRSASVAHGNGGGRVRTADNAEIFYKDWGTGQPVIFAHGWPLNADVWDDQLMFMASHGFRTIAHDRRSHGRSSQTWQGNNLDTYADDLSALIEALNLHDVILVGHSTGGGEVTRYIGRHGNKRVAKLVLIGAIPPLMLKTPENPGGLPLEVFRRHQDGGSERPLTVL